MTEKDWPEPTANENVEMARTIAEGDPHAYDDMDFGPYPVPTSEQEFEELLADATNATFMCGVYPDANSSRYDDLLVESRKAKQAVRDFVSSLKSRIATLEAELRVIPAIDEGLADVVSRLTAERDEALRQAEGVTIHRTVVGTDFELPIHFTQYIPVLEAECARLTAENEAAQSDLRKLGSAAKNYSSMQTVDRKLALDKELAGCGFIGSTKEPTQSNLVPSSNSL